MAFDRHAVHSRVPKKIAYTPAIPALRRQRLEDLNKCEASRDYAASSELARVA